MIKGLVIQGIFQCELFDVLECLEDLRFHSIEVSDPGQGPTSGSDCKLRNEIHWYWGLTWGLTYMSGGVPRPLST